MPAGVFTAQQRAFLAVQRVGHLATADTGGQPHVVPVCYAFDDHAVYIALDAKPKRVAAQELKRVRNIPTIRRLRSWLTATLRTGRSWHIC